MTNDLHLIIKSNRIKNILVIRRNNIGDMICAIPVLKSIRKAFPDACITVLADSINWEILKGASFVDKLIVYEKGKGLYSNKYVRYMQLFRKNDTQYDIAFALKIGFSSTLALITLISRAKVRVGCAPRKWHPLNMCYNSPVQNCIKFKNVHVVDGMLGLIRAAGIEQTVDDISIEVPVNSRNRAHDFLRKKKIDVADNIVVINISNNRPANIWKDENYEETARVLLREYGAAFILTSTPVDRSRAMNLSKKIRNAWHFDTPGIMDFAGLVEQSSLLLCGEGGAMHIGAAVHTPTVSLWSRGHRADWTPYGERQYVIKKGKHVNSIAADDVVETIRTKGLLK